MQYLIAPSFAFTSQLRDIYVGRCTVLKSVNPNFDSFSMSTTHQTVEDIASKIEKGYQKPLDFFYSSLNFTCKSAGYVCALFLRLKGNDGMVRPNYKFENMSTKRARQKAIH